METRSAVMVGRDADLRLLTELLDRAASGDPQLVLILGEAGLGKSRLVRELLAGLQEGVHRAFGIAAPITAGDASPSRAEHYRLSPRWSHTGSIPVAGRMLLVWAPERLTRSGPCRSVTCLL